VVKQCFIERARAQRRSLTCEIVLFLLDHYRPEGWESLAEGVRKRAALTNDRATVIKDLRTDEKQIIVLMLPRALHEHLAQKARSNFRSVNAELNFVLQRELKNVDTLSSDCAVLR
jgi:hypothetical protein